MNNEIPIPSQPKFKITLTWPTHKEAVFLLKATAVLVPFLLAELFMWLNIPFCLHYISFDFAFFSLGAIMGAFCVVTGIIFYKAFKL
jgi:hypothetical protein